MNLGIAWLSSRLPPPTSSLPLVTAPARYARAQAARENAPAPREERPAKPLAKDETSRTANGQADEEGTAANSRMREGDTIKDVIGEFKVRGDRALFVTADGKQFGCLENKILERVVSKVSDSQSQMTWRVAGQVTDYRGSNYLLVTHAIEKFKPTKSTATRAADRDEKEEKEAK